MVLPTAQDTTYGKGRRTKLPVGLKDSSAVFVHALNTIGQNVVGSIPRDAHAADITISSKQLHGICVLMNMEVRNALERKEYALYV